MTIRVGFGNGGAPTQWYLPGTNTAALPAGPPGGTPPTADALTEGPEEPGEGVVPLFGGLVEAWRFGDFAYFDVTGGWNSVKNAYVEASAPASLWFNGFVHVDVRISGEGDSSVVLIGAKRGHIVTGSGDDTILIAHLSNEGSWNNEFRIASGAGNDVVLVSTFDAEAEALWDPTYASFAGGARGVWNGTGDTTTVRASLGSGNDVFAGAASRATMIVDGGSGDDWLRGGMGTAIFTGGEGADTFVFGEGGGPGTITDFSGYAEGRAVVVGFEPPDGVANPPRSVLLNDGYFGLFWDNMGSLDPSRFDVRSGYDVGVISGSRVGFNSGAQPATVGAARLDLSSGWFTSAWNDGLLVTVEGLIDGEVVARTSFVTTTASALRVEFGAEFRSLDAVRFSTSGGTPSPIYPGGSGQHVAIDDLSLVIHDATRDNDRLSLLGLTLAEIEEVLAAAVQDGADTVLSYGAGGTLRLSGVAKESLGLGDFIVA